MEALLECQGERLERQPLPRTWPGKVLTDRYKPARVRSREHNTMPWEKQFNKEEALERAGQAFWAGGYEATCMTSLLESMGIQKGSFYATFGSKRQVLLDSLEAYIRTWQAQSRGFAQELSPRAALERQLANHAAEARGENRKMGCYVVNMALELAPHDEEVRRLVATAFSDHEEHYTELLKAGQSRGEISPELDARATARALLALVLGLRVLSRSAAPHGVIDSVLQQALALLGPAPASPKPRRRR